MVATAAVLLALAAPGMAQSDQDVSLADIARQKPAKKATHVTTDDDLPAKPPAPPEKPAAPAKTDASAPAKPGDAAAPEDPQVKAARQELEELKKQQDFYLQKVAQHKKDAEAATDPDRRQMLLNGAVTNQTNADEMKPEVEAAQKALAEAEKKAGAAHASDDAESAADAKPDDNPPPKSQ
jgi:hypothetical protein